MQLSKMLCRVTLLSASMWWLSYAEDEESNSRKSYDFERDVGGIPNDTTEETLRHNTATFTGFLKSDASYSSLYFANKTYHFYPGVYGRDIVDFHMYINGTLRFHRPDVIEAVPDTIVMDEKDTREIGRPWPCIFIEHSQDLIFSSPDPGSRYHEGGSGKNYNDESFIDTEYGKANRGVIDGHGSEFWGVPVVGYIQLREFRPDLLLMQYTSNVLIEYLIFQDSPRWTLHLDVDNLVVRYSSVVARRTYGDGHSGADMTASNTDGIDLFGTNVHVHDVDIWNQDDCIAVKDTASNMLFERIHGSGIGLVIGSIGETAVSNITFRDSFLYKPYKGIYMKFRTEEGAGLIENVLYENITILESQQWGIWIGPAQQVDQFNMLGPPPFPCNAQLCSLCWPSVPMSTCKGHPASQFKNITLRNINIYNKKGSPGVIIGSDSAPIDGIIFDNVVVSKDIPPAYQNLDRNKMFPGLVRPVDDKYVSPFKVGLYYCVIFFVALSFATLIALGIARCFNVKTGRLSPGAGRWSAIPQEEEYALQEGEKGKGGKDMRITSHKRKVLALVLGSIAIVLLIHHFMSYEEISREEQPQYFSCEGVVGGVATGTTWPVPSCFNYKA